MRGRVLIAGAIGALAAGLPARTAGAWSLDFEGLDAPSTRGWGVGESLSQGGVTASMSEFMLNEGGVITTGRARWNLYAVSLISINHYLVLDNITAQVAVPSGGLLGFAFMHSMPAGFINVTVNGASAFIDAGSLNGLTLGGVTITDTPMTGSGDPSRAALASFSGVVSSFSIGGINLAVDNFTGTPAPAPGAGTMLLGSGVLVALRRRR